MDLIYQGVVNGEISLPRWVELCSTTPARMFGPLPPKGHRSNAGDPTPTSSSTTPTGTWTISVDNHHMNMDHSAYEGVQVTGHVDTVFSRGHKIIDGGSYLGRAGDGQYLRRGLCQYLQ